MKLIDLLVQELPKRGGWPSSAIHSWCDRDGEVRFRDDDWQSDFYPSVGVDFSDRIPEMKYEDSMEYIVTRKQYEAALAASKSQWDGKFPIPPGTDVEVHFDGDDSRVWTLFRVEYMAGEVVVLHDYRIDCVDAYKQRTLSFRPIRSEADKKRAKGVIALSRVDTLAAPFEYGDKHSDGSLVAPFWYELYDAIAAGNVDGIKLED